MYKLESTAVVEVQMKLRSHWKLLCKFRWQFTRERVGQGEQHRWVYRAQRFVKMPGRAAQTGVQGTEGCSRSVQELQVEPKRHPRSTQEASSWTQDASESANLGPRGTQEPPSWTQEPPRRLQVEPTRRPRAPS